jgi:1,2-phenylacetyl-CoA epoxidase catalytic subunit
MQTGEHLAEQTQRGQEASRQLTQESLSAYMDFMNSMFSFAQQGPRAAERGAERADHRSISHEPLSPGVPTTYSDL